MVAKMVRVSLGNRDDAFVPYRWGRARRLIKAWETPGTRSVRATYMDAALW